MLDQSFSIENFLKIIDLENRKGNHIEGRYFKNTDEITKKIKSKYAELRDLETKKYILSNDDYKDKKQQLNLEKDQLKEQKEKIIVSELKIVSENISKQNFNLSIMTTKSNLQDKIYTIVDKPESYFAIKQLQTNLSRLYKVKQSNRNDIIAQIKSLLEDNFPKFIIRTDIEKFYESIPTDKIIKKINEDSLLTSKSKKFIKQILYQYRELSESSTGIPRGIGISAYLSELFMRDFDKNYKLAEDIIYYARYVDDIIIIISPKTDVDIDTYLNDLESNITKLGLKINQNKTKFMNIHKGNENHTFCYLGYKISLNQSSCKIELTTNKINKYKARIDQSIKFYRRRKNTKTQIKK
mgnify:CR=1 FL=1